MKLEDYQEEKASQNAGVAKLMASRQFASQQYTEDSNNDSEGSEGSATESPELPAHPDDVDMTHLAPLCIDESDDWPKHVTLKSIRNGSVRYYRNHDDYRGSWDPSQMASVSSDYYKYNGNNHFVWTNQLFIGKDVEVDSELNVVDMDPEKVKWLGLDRGTVINHEACDLRNPENSFQLRKVENFGLGLFAKHSIKKGSVIGEYTGELITKDEQFKRHIVNRQNNLTNYVYETGTEFVIDAGAMGNHTRFINHDCDENCLVTSEVTNGVPKITVVAYKDIKMGKQIFLNYGAGYFQNIKCLCGHKTKCLEIKKRQGRKRKIGIAKKSSIH